MNNVHEYKVEITTGQYVTAPLEQQLMIRHLLGENVECHFEIYFHWYNMIHELGHAIFEYNCPNRPHPADEEQLVNHFAIEEEVTEYVSELERIIKPLNPLLIYVDQQDVRFAFEKAIDDRPREWSEGFIEYYTTQGYGKMRGCEGVDGTVQVLEERKSIELEIFNRLKIDKHKIDNSAFDMEKCKYELRKILS
ncbi:hypothetical protein [Paenibacillus aquistagni]|uniref:hypothetical protein n=1 Tax=Paenibacillus aquistagni TaxID=1852522 RepID=UPI0015F2C25A|nr:hypothetical protein [Paenibacillus aquistagni]